jgi:hypothetical protein
MSTKQPVSSGLIGFLCLAWSNDVFQARTQSNNLANNTVYACAVLGAFLTPASRITRTGGRTFLPHLEQPYFEDFWGENVAALVEPRLF